LAAVAVGLALAAADRHVAGGDASALFSMAGALALGEYLAGAVVALMLAGGNALEESVNRRARRELLHSSNEPRAPRSSVVAPSSWEVPVGEVVTDDSVLIRVGWCRSPRWW
jgi:cation transport ATPase